MPVTTIRPLLIPATLALLAILFGFLLGGTFGAAEDSIKGHLGDSADSVFSTVYKGDQAKRDAVVSKSWSYLKRAHLHAGAIGTAALASIILLALLGIPQRAELLSAYASGIGALVYPLYWLLAGLSAPSLGSTGAAKDSLEFLAIPGAALCILGCAGTLGIALLTLAGRRTQPSS